ncbi:beta-phosphoglucomutase [Alkalithermobacter thermoalcaliphilus JW-YL-7 = DSM 7308]|uniref:Beta-phosphoglucomutase n=1 Tax=Alkalithermobacter thermoalcaliphilus JW-YL-7 = DSM 7308 TaxID=1121328 RepID=A0A150FPY0_CLOPD|nr:beta-phosphoglucomutase [[Clostridium] paradoxum JW-YL-7 = DSM 7308]SHK85887.1 beta-phosphoglucomutase [[Clostridium] paradoxum JW-YL-7 = DSM 7308]
MSIKGCIFDLDGVIVDTAKYHYIAWKRLANELGFDFTEEDNEKLKGVSRIRSLELLLELGNKSVDDKTKLELADRKNNWYVEYISKMDKSEILPGVENFLIKLKENGFKIALGSVSKNALTILKNVGLIDYFDVIVDGTKVINAKPDPEVFLKGAEGLNLNPKECCVFEDAIAGIQAAKKCNMKVIGVGSEEILSDADIVICGFENVDIDILNFT